MTFKYWFLWLLLLLLLPTTSGAVCSEPAPHLTPCDVLTPSLSCGSYTYWIYNASGVSVDSGLLSPFDGDGVYSFTINLTAGYYIAKVCDGSTRELVVGESEVSSTMSLLSISAILAFVVGVSLWFAGRLPTRDQRENPIPFNIGLRILLYALAGLTFYFLVQLAYGIVLEGGYSDAVLASVQTVYQFLTIGMGILLVLLFLGIMWSVFAYIIAWGASLSRRRGRGGVR